MLTIEIGDKIKKGKKTAPEGFVIKTKHWHGGDAETSKTIHAEDKATAEFILRLARKIEKEQEHLWWPGHDVALAIAEFVEKHPDSDTIHDYNRKELAAALKSFRETGEDIECDAVSEWLTDNLMEHDDRWSGELAQLHSVKVVWNDGKGNAFKVKELS